ncbi:MAG TPA: glutamate--tRNA ligase [Acidimicrobiales bacterium]|nr:glutamate--tRNA ligase [Acidimicrobiales bacterium]
MPAPRLRFAPSPTGWLHVGGARTVLFNWLVARRYGGEMLLRIEDTDTERNRPELTDDILAEIEWLGLAWDGEPVHQSDRLHLHTKAASELRAAGVAYWCDCTAEQVQARAKQRGGPPGYDGHCRDRGLAQGPGTALRFRAPDVGTTSFEDLVRGTVTFGNDKIEDFVLLRSNGVPTFLLANVVDDVDMGITHVVRGEEHVNGTPKYLLIGDALGFDHRPVFAHLPVLVDERRKKLSKRRDGDAVSVAEFRQAGYLPEAMVNYLATLGWGPPDGVEIRPLAEIVGLFDLDAVTPSPAFFDTKKLTHFNAEYIRALATDEFVARARPFFAHGDATEAVLSPLAREVQERVRLLSEVEPMVDFLRTDDVEIDEASWQRSVVKLGDRAGAMLDAAAGGLAACLWEREAVEAALSDAALAAGFVNAEGNPQMSKAQGPVRVAVTGRSVGPPLYESLVVLGRERTLARLRAARSRL